MKYVIHSQSEKGFWHSKQGWVYGISQATKFHDTSFNVPITKNNDAEFIVVKYED